jgi:hypothetical protein
MWHSMPLIQAASLDPRGGCQCALCRRAYGRLGRPVSESGRLGHGDGSREGMTAAGGFYCWLSSPSEASNVIGRLIHRIQLLGMFLAREVRAE